MSATRHAVRFKGVTLGNLTSAEVAERLRAGEISLAHAIEHRGRWMTVRQFLSEADPVTPAAGFLGRLTGQTAGAPGMPPPPPGAPAAVDSIESRVRTGYLWCGLTFVLPLPLGLATWPLVSAPSDRPDPLRAVLCLCALGGAGYAAWRAQRCAAGLKEEGLEDVGASLVQLALSLAAASALFWITVTLRWVGS